MNDVACNNCGGRETRLITNTTSVGNSGERRLSVVACAKCGLCFLSPQPTPGMYEEFYSTYGRKNRTLATLIREKEPQKDYISLIAEYIQPESRILDIGCGKGIFLKFLKDKGYTNLFGIDLSKVETVFAREQFDLNVACTKLDSYDQQNFDLIILNAVVEHLNDPKATLASVRDLLAPGGLVLISTPNVKDPVLRKGVSSYFKFVHPYYFSQITLSSVLEQVGFEVLVEKVLLSHRPHNFFKATGSKDGELVVLARKVERRGEVRLDDCRDTLTQLRKARRKDLLAAWTLALSRVRGIGFLFRVLGIRP